MKFLSILTLLLLTYNNSFAQLEKGTIAVGMSIGGHFQNNKYDYPESHYWGVDVVTYGELFIKQHLSIVAGIGYTHQYEKSGYEYISGMYRTNILRTQFTSPFVGIKKYWMIKDGPFGLYMMPHGLIQFYNKTSSEEFTNTTGQPFNHREKNEDSYSLYLNADAGLCYFMTPKLSLELNTHLLTCNFASHYQNIELIRNLSGITVGGRYYFN
jgi:hypothetical protein